MKRIAFIFLRLLVALYAIIAFPIWVLSCILWILWNVMLLLIFLPIAWIFLGGWYDDKNISDNKSCDWMVSLKWWRKKLNWEYWGYNNDIDNIPQWYFYYLHKMSEYCD